MEYIAAAVLLLIGLLVLYGYGWLLYLRIMGEGVVLPEWGPPPFPKHTPGWWNKTKPLTNRYIHVSVPVSDEDAYWVRMFGLDWWRHVMMPKGSTYRKPVEGAMK